VHKLGTVSVGESNPVRIMGILNTSPESFYKKSIRTSKRNITQAVRLIEAQGADIIDVGGMSTAPYLSTMIPEKNYLSGLHQKINLGCILHRNPLRVLKKFVTKT